MDTLKKAIIAGAKIIDVRTPEEFKMGHIAGSVNIPLIDIPSRMHELKNLNETLVLCCVTGNRSGQAAYFLEQNGLQHVLNGGSWLELNALIEQIHVL